MKQYKAQCIITTLVIVVLIVPASIAAINSIDFGFRLGTSGETQIDAHNECRTLANSGSHDYFIPTKASNEWNAFMENTPADVSLNTCFICGTSTVDDADGNTYDTVVVGDQCWMKQNMRVGTHIDGPVDATDNGTIEKYCYNDNSANCTTAHPNEPDGGLYTWDEAMQYSTTPGAQGICPAGWHIPTDTELYTMENYLDNTVNDPSAIYWRGTDIGTKLKPNGPSGLEWNSAGYLDTRDGSFEFRDTYGFIWTSSEYNSTNGWRRTVAETRSDSYRDGGGKVFAISVRCLKNSDNWYDISAATFYDSVLNATYPFMESSPSDILFNDDGTTLYLMGKDNNQIAAYPLATPYAFDNYNEDNASSVLSTSGTYPESMLFNDDGTTLYITGSQRDAIDAYTLSTPYDISTATLVGEVLDVQSQENGPQSIIFNDDGTVLYLLGFGGDEVNAYTLSTPYDISTASFDSVVLDVSSEETTPKDMMFNDDGTTLYVMGVSGDDINAYALNTPYDISTASFESIALDISSQETVPTALIYNNNGSQLLVLGIDVNVYTID